jgi:hypothetical protein
MANYAIILMEDNHTKYLNYYDIVSQKIANYFEYDQLILSGCKKFVWLVLKE